MIKNFIKKKRKNGSSQKEILPNSTYTVQKLHDYSHLIDECCNLINMEWKRSHTARMRSIDGSNENFPMSLILLEKKSVVGHCKISRLSMSNTKVFIETVVIHPKLRGKGLGKFLMLAAEEICMSKDIKWIYLATKGQEGFYQKLGYTECPPVSIYGCQSNDFEEESKINDRKNMTDNNNRSVPTDNAPPPPPMTQMLIKNISDSLPCTKTFMRKELLINK